MGSLTRGNILQYMISAHLAVSCGVKLFSMECIGLMYC